MSLSLHRQLTGLGLVVLLSTRVFGQFDITVVFLDGLTPSQEQIFSTAEGTWESLISDYQPGISLTGLIIRAKGEDIDGVDGILAQGGPTQFQFQGGYWLSSAGRMTFDIADLSALEAEGSLLDVILHEMGHVLGIGTLWGSNDVYESDTGQYTGEHGVAAYQLEFDQATNYIPVELGGGIGTSNGHWNEVDGGDRLTGITDSFGNDFRNELMTGWLDAPTFLSNTTVQSLRDIGFVVVPEPSGLLWMLVGSLFWWHRRIRCCTKTGANSL